MKLTLISILTFVCLSALSEQPVLSIDTNRLVSIAKEAIGNSKYKIDADELELQKISYECSETLAEEFFIAFKYNLNTEVIVDKRRNRKTIKTTFECPVVEMDKMGNVLSVRCSSTSENKSEILDKDKPSNIETPPTEKSSKSTDDTQVPYLPNFDVLGFKFGESLQRSGQKADLLLSSDLGKTQFFNLLNPPQKTFEKVTLAYRKITNASNRLFLVQIDYEEDRIERDSLLDNFPAGGEVIESGVNKVGNFVHKVSYHMESDSEKPKTIPVTVSLIERRHGTLYMVYCLTDML